MIKPNVIDAKCYYVKRIDDKHFEHGHYDINKKAIKGGVKPTLEEALAANSMTEFNHGVAP